MSFRKMKYRPPRRGGGLPTTKVRRSLIFIAPRPATRDGSHSQRPHLPAQARACAETAQPGPGNCVPPREKTGLRFPTAKPRVAKREGQMAQSTIRTSSKRLWTRRSAAKLIAGAASAVFAPSIVRAAEKTVYLLTWGGTIQAMLERDGWSKKFAAATGYEVVLVPKATGVEIMATAIAQKSKPQVDVVQSDLLPWLGGIEQALYAPLDKDGVPNLAKLYG